MRYICCPFLRITSPFYTTASCAKKIYIDIRWCGGLVWARKLKFKWFLNHLVTSSYIYCWAKIKKKGSLRVLSVVFVDFTRLTRKLFLIKRFTEDFWGFTSNAEKNKTKKNSCKLKSVFSELNLLLRHVEAWLGSLISWLNNRYEKWARYHPFSTIQ